MNVLVDVMVVMVVVTWVCAIAALAMVMVGNWRYHRMKKNDRMSDEWLARHR